MNVVGLCVEGIGGKVCLREGELQARGLSELACDVCCVVNERVEVGRGWCHRRRGSGTRQGQRGAGRGGGESSVRTPSVPLAATPRRASVPPLV